MKYGPPCLTHIVYNDDTGLTRTGAVTSCITSVVFNDNKATRQETSELSVTEKTRNSRTANNKHDRGLQHCPLQKREGISVLSIASKTANFRIVNYKTRQEASEMSITKQARDLLNCQ